MGALNDKINATLNYWQQQNISFSPCNALTENYQLLPNDFQKLYAIANGMTSCYPNDNDQEGFLFYPVEYMWKAPISDHSETLIFADYMQQSWWYGIRIQGQGYEIGIMPERTKFVTITDSLATFLEMYLTDAPVLYEY